MLVWLKGRGRGLESQSQSCVWSLPLALRQPLLEPALQCAVGFDAPFQLCPQSLDLGQQVTQVADRVLPLPGFS